MSLLETFEAAGEVRGRVAGVGIGIVTNNKDETGLGRVKVRFPWRENAQDSYWARIAVLMAGKDRGTFFIPEPGDEVLCAFDNDDIRHPYVIGSLWNGQDLPPASAADGRNNIRKIKSRSGHEIIFGDDAQARTEHVEIHTKGGHKIRLDDSAGAEKIEIVDKTGGNSIVIDSTQNSMTIKSALSLKIESQTIEIKAGAAMTIKSGATMTLEGALIKIN